MEMVLVFVMFIVFSVLFVNADKRYRRLKKQVKTIEKRLRLARPELLPCIQASYARHLELETPMFRAEMGEDILCIELFGADHKGIFVEVGGYDGITNSATYVLEQLGWDGLLIEPVDELCQQAKRVRSHAKVIHAAVSKRGSDGVADFIHFESTDDRSHADLASRLDSANAVKNSRDASEGVRKRTPLTSIAAQLREHFPDRQADLIIIDVEGAELDAIDGVEIESLKPRMVMVENHDHQSSIGELMSSYGYTKLFCLDFNYFFVHQDDEQLLNRAKELGLDQVGVS